MPKISIIVAAYNVENYLQQCLDSLSNQTFPDFEAIVVDDASTDATTEIIRHAAAKDPRIRPITHQRNQGLHLTRKTGVEHATGEYAFFLDGDDDLAPEACAQFAKAMSQYPVDILHFGITVIGENGILDDECKAFETFNNAPTEDCTNADIVQNIYAEANGQQVDWRVTQRMYRTSLLKKAFAAMTNERLERAEDGYECLVISALAHTYRSCKECRGYKYHYGRGVTGTNQITVQKYADFCQQFARCFAAAQDFTNQHQDLDLQDCTDGYRWKATEILANDLNIRVPDVAKADAIQAMIKVDRKSVV